MPKICQRYARDMPKIYTRYAQDMPKMCSRYTQDMPKIRSRYARDMSKICPRYAQDMPEICTRYAQDMHKICQRNMQKKSWGKMSWGKMSTIFTQVGAKCPWGILSWGILSFGAKCLGAKCLLAVSQWVINVFSGIPANQVSSFVQKDTASPIHFSCRGHLSAAGSRLRSQNDNQICQTHSQFQWRFKVWWITVFRCLH